MATMTASKSIASETASRSSTTSTGVHAIHAMLVSFAVACFTGAFITDIVYWRSMSFIWETFSVWLLTAGLVVSGLAVIAGLIDVTVNRHRLALRSAWAYGLGSALVIVLSLFNVFIHSRDGYTAVVPAGITLSGIAVLIMIATGWVGGETLARPRIGGSC